ncbi:MAG TPA: hypothetical protein VHH88_08175, partial [Verrucomicrobiae bacterium]|nr:hypothetical protein [Verrucomicrobiae bacterium]
LTPHGTLYRIDLRLRPEGDTGPLARSLAAYENYYAQWGQTWERMMLIKARGVAGDVALAGEFLEMVQPFRYPRSMSAGVPREVAEMKERIENEVVRRGDLEWNVKLGRGGIREVEFAAQCLQLLHAGRQPFLQGARTLPCLEKLLQYELISSAEAKALSEAYCFLRDVEHRLQMDNNLQTHTIPEDRLSRERLGRLMGFTGWNSFNAAYSSHRKKVRAIFDRILKADPASGPSTPSLPRGFDGTEARWKEILAAHGFRDAEAACRVLREFVEGPGFLHVSPRTAQLAAGLIPRFLALCPQVAPGKAAVPAASPPRPENDAPPRAARLPSSTGAPLSDPDRVLTRLDSFIAAYGARATLFELWNSNPAIFELLILVFDRSEFLAELAIRTPDLLDELVTSDRLRQRKSAGETLADLRHGLSDADQHLWLRRYQQAELMRIGCRDILGLADEDQYLSELSALAEACLRYALEAVLRKHRIARAPFAVIGLGKFGGAEIDYGSDLDIVFVAGKAARNLPRLAQLAREIMDLLSRRTEQGVVFETDARLRPDGDKGLLVNTLAAYEDYYRQRALLWEIQSLTRARLIAGDESNGAEFEALAARLANFQRPNLPLSAWTEDWKKTIREMRARIERERTPAGKDALAIKTGKGGLVDAEFLAQALCLEHGWREPNTQRALERARETRQIKTAGALIDSYQRLRRLEGILRRWSYEGETVLPDAPEPYHRVAVRCGFKDSNAFQNEIASWRKRIRVSYSDYFGLSE